MALELGLLLALASAAAANIGFLLRHRGAVAAPDVDPRHPLRSAAGLFRSKWWTIGYLVALAAYLLHVGALALAPLSLVQAVLSGGLVLLGVFAERLFGFELGRREWAGVGLAAVGLAFLALTGRGGESGEESARYSLPAMLAFESALVGVGAALILSGRSGRAGDRYGLLLGASAGLLFTVAHIAVKALTDKTDSGALALLLSPFLLLALAAWIVAFFASARSLQIGEAVAVIAVTSIAGNICSIPAGIIVFGDPLGSDALSIALRSAAFVLVVVAAALIPAPTRATQERPRREPAYETGWQKPAPAGGPGISRRQ
jgi:drug/metabolite transporter (DMT)-like permease